MKLYVNSMSTNMCWEFIHKIKKQNPLNSFIFIRFEVQVFPALVTCMCDNL